MQVCNVKNFKLIGNIYDSFTLIKFNLITSNDVLSEGKITYLFKCYPYSCFFVGGIFYIPSTFNKKVEVGIMAEKVKNSFVVHCDWVDSMNDLPAEQCKLLIQAMSEYTKTGLIPTIENPTVKALFSFIHPKMKDDKEKYEAKCKKRKDKAKQAADKRWEGENQPNTKPCLGMLTDAHECSAMLTDAKPCLGCYDHDNDHDSDNDYDNDNDNEKILLNKKEKEKGKNKPNWFVTPSIEEIKAYCIERKNKVDAENFFDFYQAKGWKIGSNPMKDWKAAVRTWERRDNNYGSVSPPRRSAVSEFFAED